MEHSAFYKKCELCARKCGVDRNVQTGYCKCGTVPKIARVGLHMWEEPIISGTRGSGTIFFSGCSLGCIYCQNNEISRCECGIQMGVDELADAMIRLQSDGAHNVNFVTPTHFSPTVKAAVKLAKSNGLNIPIVYNTSSYDSVKALKNLEGCIDVYLPDLKYYRPKTAKNLSMAGDYPIVARAAIDEMVRQKPTPVIQGGIMRAGVIVRLLLLPGHVAESKLNLKYLYDRYGDKIYVSLMSQYTPTRAMPPPLNRRVTEREYAELVDYADKIGVKNAFIQERSSSIGNYVPDFKI